MKADFLLVIRYDDVHLMPDRQTSSPPRESPVRGVGVLGWLIQ
jgi:hypothetical protein